MTTILTIFLLLSEIRAEAVLQSMGLTKPKLGAVYCIQSGPQGQTLRVYLLKDNFVFNRDRSLSSVWPEVKGQTGEYVLEKGHIVYFTPGTKPLYTRLGGGGFSATIRLHNDGVITQKTFEAPSPWDAVHMFLVNHKPELSCLSLR